MRLEWMGEYREILEKLIHYCNVYSAVSKEEISLIEGVSLTFSQLQVVEYLLENEEQNQNMSSVAVRLGITFSTFSKLINKLEEKGLLEKFYLEGNRKNIVVRVSDLGRRVYAGYVEQIMSKHFQAMFDVFDQIPKEYLALFAKALSSPFCFQTLNEKIEAEKPVLIPCRNHDK